MSFLTDDPFEIWLMRDEVSPRRVCRKTQRVIGRDAGCARSAPENVRPSARQRPEPDEQPRAWIGPLEIACLPGEDVARAEELYRRVYATGGTGTTYVQEGLLFIIGAACQPASIAFWRNMLNLTRPRDTFTTKRRTTALAALAYLAVHDNAEAETVLAQCTQHANADIRAQAVFYWGEIYLARKQPLPTGRCRHVDGRRTGCCLRPAL